MPRDTRRLAGPGARLARATAVRSSGRMDVQEIIHKAQESLSVQRVFGAPVEREDVTVIPVAAVRGGGGGGGPWEAREETGAGGGFGAGLRGIGVFELRDGRVRWRPAIDLNRAILGAQVVAALAILAWRSVARQALSRRFPARRLRRRRRRPWRRA